MSKRKWRERAASAVATVLGAPAPAEAPGFVEPEPEAAPPFVALAGGVALEEPAHVGPAEPLEILPDPQPANPCGRPILFADAFSWRCACGAEGRTGSTADGLPYNDETTLAHAPGESKGAFR